MSRRVRTTRRLEAWLKEASVALFVLNSQRRLVFFNVGCEKLSGWLATDVLGQVCHYVTEPDATLPDALLASLTPPAMLWEGTGCTVPVTLVHREQTPIVRQIQYLPLTDAEHTVQAVLGIIQDPIDYRPTTDISYSQRLHAELAELRQSIWQQFSEPSLVGRSPAMRRLLGQIKLARNSATPLLFIGEVGTGREQLARSIHAAHDNQHKAFVPLDCRSLPSDHLETTLERLTSAHNFDESQPGTVYFNDVESLSRHLQSIVLKLIESNHPTRPRVMAAARMSLERLVEADEFSSELYFALTSLSLLVPPLRNRGHDLELLAQAYLEQLNQQDPKQVDGFHEDVWSQFRRYNWPGNVSELRSVIIEARTECAGSLIETCHLPFRFRTGIGRQAVGPSTRKRVVPLDPLLLQIEREQIELALAEAHQNKAKAAELLGITRPRLYRRMEVLQILDTESSATDDTGE